MRRKYSKGIIITIICVLLCSSSLFYGLSSARFSNFPPALVIDASAQTTTESETETDTAPTTESETETDTAPTTESETETDTAPTTESETDLNNAPEASSTNEVQEQPQAITEQPAASADSELGNNTEINQTAAPTPPIEGIQGFIDSTIDEFTNSAMDIKLPKNPPGLKEVKEGEGGTILLEHVEGAEAGYGTLITIGSLGSGIVTVKDYADTERVKLVARGVTKLSEVQDVLLPGGIPAKVVTYDCLSGCLLPVGAAASHMDVYVYVGGKAYLLHFFGDPDQFAETSKAIIDCEKQSGLLTTLKIGDVTGAGAASGCVPAAGGGTGGTGGAGGTGAASGGVPAAGGGTGGAAGGLGPGTGVDTTQGGQQGGAAAAGSSSQSGGTDLADNANQPQSQIEFTQYENAAHGIRIMYPANWTISEFDTKPVVVFSAAAEAEEEEEAAAPIAQQQDNVTRSPATVILNVNSSSSSLPIQDMTQDQFSADYMARLINSPTYYDLVLNDVSGLNNTTSVINGTNQQEAADASGAAVGGQGVQGNSSLTFNTVEYSGTSFVDGSNVRGIDLWTVINGKLYSITYLAVEPLYFTYLPLVQQMINSFEIIAGGDATTSTATTATTTTSRSGNIYDTAPR
jgi:hypothetical protein